MSFQTVLEFYWQEMSSEKEYSRNAGIGMEMRTNNNCCQKYYNNTCLRDTYYLACVTYLHQQSESRAWQRAQGAALIGWREAPASDDKARLA